jgi:hypothetical protein
MNSELSQLCLQASGANVAFNLFYVFMYPEPLNLHWLEVFSSLKELEQNLIKLNVNLDTWSLEGLRFHFQMDEQLSLSASS